MASINLKCEIATRKNRVVYACCVDIKTTRKTDSPQALFQRHPFSLLSRYRLQLVTMVNCVSSGLEIFQINFMPLNYSHIFASIDFTLIR